MIENEKLLRIYYKSRVLWNFLVGFVNRIGRAGGMFTPRHTSLQLSPVTVHPSRVSHSRLTFRLNAPFGNGTTLRSLLQKIGIPSPKWPGRTLFLNASDFPTFRHPGFLICFIIGIFFLIVGCNPVEEELPDQVQKNYCLEESFKEQIEWEQPINQAVTEHIPLTGVIEPNPDKVIHFVSLVSGIISNTYFSLGDRVSKGQVLAELRSTELANLQSQATTIESQIEVAERNLRSIQSMFDDGIASQISLVEAQSKLDVLIAEREKIQSNLHLFSASTEKGVFQIKSPNTGIVTAKSISAGSQITAEGESLFTISDLREVWALVNVYATNVTSISTGMPVKIKTLSYPDEVFEGKIGAISQVLDAEAKVLKARVVLPNSNLKLKPGMIIDVTALKELETEALSIPASALVFDDNQNYVVVYKNDCELENRYVEILLKNNGMAFISEGLEEDERVISKNHLLIYEQLKNFQR